MILMTLNTLTHFLIGWVETDNYLEQRLLHFLYLVFVKSKPLRKHFIYIVLSSL